MSQANQRCQAKSLPRVLLFLLAAVLLFSAGSSAAGENPRQSEELLRATYLRNMARLETSSFGLPLFLESSERDGRVHADVYGIFDHPFGSVADVLKIPVNWCDIVTLHPNVKACISREVPSAWLLTFYLGRKFYQPLEDTHQVIYQYRQVARQPGYLDIILSAGTGPFGTKDHRMRFEALSLAGGRTFVHVSYAYSDSAALRLAEKIYFTTLGRDKVGFTVTGTGRNGKPVYVGGPRGAIERNAVRYYFAIHAFMNSLRYPVENRFSRRSSEWYDLTVRYREQLFDLDKKDYLIFKTKEHENQLILQQRIGTGLR